MALLQSANRSFEYLALRPRVMSLVTSRGDNLEREFSALVQDIALQLRPDELSRDAICEITISSATHPETFSALARGDAAIVSLMPEHVPAAQKERWDERVRAVGIRINGLNSESPVNLRALMVSCGITWFRKRDGQPVSMRIPMRDAGDVVVSTALDLDEVRVSQNLIGTETVTVDASPYGLWKLRIPGVEAYLTKNKEEEAKGQEPLSLTFCFIGTARISNKVAALIDTRRQELLPLLARPMFDPLRLGGAPAVAAPAPEKGHESAEKKLPEVWPGSPLEEAVLVRIVEDMVYVPVYYPKSADDLGSQELGKA